MQPSDLVRCAMLEQGQSFHLRIRLLEDAIGAELAVPAFQRDGGKVLDLMDLRDFAAKCFRYWTLAVPKWTAEVAEA